MVGPNQRMAASNARRIEYAPGGYVSCGTGMFANRTIRAQVNEIQKANVGRKSVFFATPKVPRDTDRFHIVMLNTFVDMLRLKIDVRSTRRRSRNCKYTTFETPETA